MSSITQRTTVAESALHHRVDILVLLVLGAYVGYRIGFGKAFTINQLANRQALLFLIDNPELFTEVGLIEGTVFDRHSDKLATVGIPRRDADHATLRRFIQEVPQETASTTAIRTHRWMRMVAANPSSELDLTLDAIAEALS